ncbi:hypothetical protein T4B_435 [Trichinella pseudospiralis]|uniref:Uncharacterized protein n=1 Tax=Trichinella pseudospiralis TaxID=6337 RepID=A0A0V1IQB7_TRIPS|nr:hypothetical protein T4B_435 [Trichinella pseudospiralis]KRZ24991.1 hypothetical protein T4C_4205 [Trichinella pseudospiralis]
MDNYTFFTSARPITTDHAKPNAAEEISNNADQTGQSMNIYKMPNLYAFNPLDYLNVNMFSNDGKAQSSTPVDWSPVVFPNSAFPDDKSSESQSFVNVKQVSEDDRKGYQEKKSTAGPFPPIHISPNGNPTSQFGPWSTGPSNFLPSLDNSWMPNVVPQQMNNQFPMSQMMMQPPPAPSSSQPHNEQTIFPPSPGTHNHNNAFPYPNENMPANQMPLNFPPASPYANSFSNSNNNNNHNHPMMPMDFNPAAHNFQQFINAFFPNAVPKNYHQSNLNYFHPIGANMYDTNVLNKEKRPGFIDQNYNPNEGKQSPQSEMPLPAVQSTDDVNELFPAFPYSMFEPNQASSRQDRSGRDIVTPSNQPSKHKPYESRASVGRWAPSFSADPLNTFSSLEPLLYPIEHDSWSPTTNNHQSPFYPLPDSFSNPHRNRYLQPNDNTVSDDRAENNLTPLTLHLKPANQTSHIYNNDADSVQHTFQDAENTIPSKDEHQHNDEHLNKAEALNSTNHAEQLKSSF